MTRSLPQVALMYDFDKTLSTHDMLDYGFIPRIGQSPEDFWRRAAALAEESQMDSVLCYMYMMMQSPGAGRPSAGGLRALGREVVFFPGVEGWFDRLHSLGAEPQARRPALVISAGLRGDPLGTGSRAVPQVYACDYHHDQAGEADWPDLVFTGKTQYLFRINKGVLDVSNDADLNRHPGGGARRAL